MANTLSGSYTIDRKRSIVSINGTSSVHPIHMRSSAPEGELTLGDSPSGSLVIPAGSLRTGQPLQDLELRRQIQARRHKTIEATLREVRSVNGDVFAVGGDITFMGVTQPADGTLTITSVDDDEISIAGEASIDVRDFGFDPPNILGVKVHPNVTVAIELIGVRTSE